MLIDRSVAFERYVRAVDRPLTVLAAAMIPLLLAPVVARLSGEVERTLVAIDYVIWAIFAVDYVARVSLSTARWRFVWTHPFDLLIVVLPFLRPLRLVRSIRILRAIRALRLAAFVGRGLHATSRIIRHRGLNYVLLVVVGLVLLAAAIVTEVERGVDGANIGSFPDALWWAVTTITTVGYGDHFPVTAAGRGVAAGLMILGIALLGIVTASIAAYFVESEENPGQAELLAELRAIRARLEVLETVTPQESPQTVERSVSE